MESADDAQRDVRSLILTMIDGDGSQISMFDEVVKQFGFADWTAGNLVTDPQRTAARNAWLQIDSAYNKTSGDGSVSGVRSARDQLFDFLRQ
jgi:hypothetical protein